MDALTGTSTPASASVGTAGANATMSSTMSSYERHLARRRAAARERQEEMDRDGDRLHDKGVLVPDRGAGVGSVADRERDVDRDRRERERERERVYGRDLDQNRGYAHDRDISRDRVHVHDRDRSRDRERARESLSEHDDDERDRRGSSSRDMERYYRAEPRRPITRVNRACNGCRRAKIRCIGADRPPCERCWANRTECVVEKPPSKDGNGSGNGNAISSTVVEDRLQSLEAQMGTMRDLLEQVVSAVRPDLGGSRGRRSASRSGSPRERATGNGSSNHPSNNSHNAHSINSHSSKFWYPPVQSEATNLARYPGNDRGSRERLSRPPAPTTESASSPRQVSSDPLALEEMINPIGRLRTMTTRLEEEGHIAKRPRPILPPRTEADGDDLIAQGVISEEDAAALVDIFYQGSSDYINVYDRTVDDFASLRRKSVFGLTAVMMVGARVRDGGRPPSRTRTACIEATKRMGVEDVRALILLAAFTDNGWLIGGHAVRIAIDLGLNRAFEELVQSGMGAGKAAAELDKDRALLLRARVWLAVYRLEHQMSYGMGRPAIVREDSTIHNCRLLLDHPLSLDSDVRLVYAVELIALRAPLHVELTATPDLPLDAATLARLRWANEQFDAWETHWADELTARYGPSGFVHESLAMQRQLAELFINSQLLRGVRSAEDVKAMSADKRALALRAMHNALKCGEIARNGVHYNQSFPYGTHYTHVCAAFAASFLIRITRLFPEELDPASVAKDVEGIADMLSRVPAGRYARSLRLILHRARREGILPAADRVEDMPRPRPRPGPGYPADKVPDTAVPVAATPDWLAAFDLGGAGAGTGPGSSGAGGEYGTGSGSGTGSGPGHGQGHGHAQGPGQGPGQEQGPGQGQGQVFIPHLAAPLDFDHLTGHLGYELTDVDSLPLFLSGELGTSVRPSDTVNFVGLEDFFVPPELDTLLSGFGGGSLGP